MELQTKTGKPVEEVKEIESYINKHLESGGVVQVTTYLRSWLLDKRHLGCIFERKGELFMRHGKRADRLTMNGSFLVGIRFGRFGKG
jgi:hypothetical protein